MSQPRGATAILGGTFDPIHLGHVAVARQVLRELGLERVLLIPSYQPPHRPAPAARPADRLAMARLAVTGLVGLDVDDVEVRREGVSYTVDTLRQLKLADPRRDLVLLLGQDAALEFDTWHQVAAIGDLARVAVFNRAGRGAGTDQLLESGLPAGTMSLAVDSPDISATEVRARLAAGEDVSGMLPPSVLEYIREHGMYNTHG